MTINFSHIGNILGARVLGEEIRKEISSALARNEFVTFDFSGVDFISHGFADECFGKLLLTMKIEELKKKTTFKNANTLVKRTIAFALKERLLQLKSV
ncbi:STAS-like domain-containing protein [Aquiflexum balticum]|nr:STAS-like domain-containing protein [Aquiflexum balticum]